MNTCSRFRLSPHAAPMHSFDAVRAVGRLALLAALIVATATSGAVRAQSDQAGATPSITGAWLPTGTMMAARLDHTAVLLPDGRVLAAGGYVGKKRVATAELYDPATRAWRATGSMNEDRAGALAVLLPNGSVALVGGNHGIDASSITTEIYDVASETWRIHSGPKLLAGYSMAALRAGRVVVMGFSELTPVAWLFDPAADTWTQIPADPVARYGGQSVLALLDGGVLVSGGAIDYLDDISPVSELFDPATGAWSLTGGEAVPREAETRTLLRDGSVLVAGGWVTVPQGGGSAYVDTRSAEIYDAAGGAWRTVGDLGEARNTHVAAHLADGSVLVVGGIAYPAYPRTTERYDPFTGTFTALADFGTRFADFSSATATLLRDGSVLLVGARGARIFRPSGISTTRVVEYVNAALDHYFLTASQLEIDALDSGRMPGWVRTGLDMTASMKLGADPREDIAPAGVVDICRIYIPAGSGSHFYSASAEECTAALAQHPEYVLEASSAFLAALPDVNTGACPADTSPVYRLWNGRPDSNHRYTTSAGVRQAFIARGYISEGYGSAGVVFCVGPAAAP